MPIKPFPFIEADSAAKAGATDHDADPGGRAVDLLSTYQELRGYTESLFEEYERLCSESARLRDHVTSVEAERDDLSRQVSDLTERLSSLESQAEMAAQTLQTVRDHTASWMEENSSRLEGYELMKKLLRGLFENADTVFTSVITTEQREKMCNLLERLP